MILAFEKFVANLLTTIGRRYIDHTGHVALVFTAITNCMKKVIIYYVTILFEFITEVRSTIISTEKTM